MSVSGLNWIMPNGASGPGIVLPPAPPGTGFGAVLGPVPISGWTDSM